MKRPPTSPIAQISVAALFVIFTAYAGYTQIGLPPVLIVGGSGMAALIAWSRTYLRRPVDPAVILPGFLLTVAALEVHMTEEYLTGFGPAMSRLFNITWTERGFLLVFAFIGPAIYALTALGLFYRVRLAGFMAWFIFIGPGIAEFSHFIFPFIRPALAPEVREAITHTFRNGITISGMRNYYLGTTRTYYFAGMYTAILPMIPGIYSVIRLLRTDRKLRQAA